MEIYEAWEIFSAADAACRLASAHAHRWASIEVGPNGPRRGLEANDLVAHWGDEAALTGLSLDRQGPADQIAGIQSPQFEGDCIAHTTATGRLRWVIAPTGVIVLEVHRPGTGAVLRVKDSYLQSQYPGIARVEVMGAYAHRHLDTLSGVLALLGHQTLSPDLWAGCEDREEIPA